MTTCHLVAWLQTTFNGEVDLDHFEYARRQLITLGQLLTLFFKGQIKLMALLLKRLFGLLKYDSMVFIRKANVKPLPAIEVNQILFGYDCAFSKLTWTTVDDLFNQHLFDTVKRVIFNNTQLVIQVLAITTQLIINNGLCTLVAHDAFARKDLNVNHCADHARGDA